MADNHDSAQKAAEQATVETSKQRRLRKQRERRAAFVAAGLCDCGHPRAEGRKRCRPCLDGITKHGRVYVLERYRACWHEALAHYGDCCAHCGERRHEFLNIDHIHGGGKRQRDTESHSGGRGFAYWLKRQGWPDGYQILCWNCNWRKYLSEVAARPTKPGDESSRRWRAKLKCQVIEAYGGRCACCGIAEQIVLTVDHIDGSGAEARGGR